MSWFVWLLIGMWSLEAIVRIALIGVPRTELTRADAVASVIFNALLVWGVVTHLR